MRSKSRGARGSREPDEAGGWNVNCGDPTFGWVAVIEWRPPAEAGERLLRGPRDPRTLADTKAYRGQPSEIVKRTLWDGACGRIYKWYLL